MLPFPCIMNSMQKWKCNTGNSRIWTPAPFSSASRADGITGGSQIYFHPYNEVSFKQCYILLNSSQGFPWLFFFPLDMVTTATGTQTALFPAWCGFVGCLWQLEFSCDQMCRCSSAEEVYHTLSRTQSSCKVTWGDQSSGSCRQHRQIPEPCQPHTAQGGNQSLWH